MGAVQEVVEDQPDIFEDGAGLNLEGILEEALLADYKRWPKAMKIYASELGVALGPEHGPCPRAFWHKCRDEPRNDPSVGALLMFKMGDLIHDFFVELLTKVLPKHGWEVVDAEQNAREYGIRGRYDLKIRHIESGTIRIIDFKTKRGNAFSYLQEPKPGDVLQVQYYTDVEDAEGGDLLYIDREGQNFVRHFPIESEPDRPQEAARRLHDIRDDEEPPAPLQARLRRNKNKGADSIYLKNPWQVDWCDLKKCPCGDAIGKVPKGIVAKVTNKGAVKMTDGNEEFADQVLALLEQDYPDEDFFLDE